jgi:glycosyltransferase involved in cell wall biosynthesis
MKATIMIPAYNAAQFLPRALDSALTQTYSGDYEILAVNDGSTDETPEILEDFRGRHSGLVRVIHQENGGNAVARNTLLEESRGELLFGLDADDILSPKALKKIIEAYDAFPGTDHVYTDQVEIDEQGNLISERRRSTINRFIEELTYHCHFQGHLKSFRKSFIGDSRFDEELRSAVDWDFFLKIFPRANILHLPEVLYGYRINSEGISVSRRKEVIQNSINLVEKYVRVRGFYSGRDFSVVPVNAGENIHYYDHFVDGKSTMNPEARKILERYLREGH